MGTTSLMETSSLYVLKRFLIFFKQSDIVEQLDIEI